MQKFCFILLLALTAACTTLTKQEQNELRNLKAQGVTVDRPAGSFERPANPGAAGALNLLPGIGNFIWPAATAATVRTGFTAASICLPGRFRFYGEFPKRRLTPTGLMNAN